MPWRIVCRSVYLRVHHQFQGCPVCQHWSILRRQKALLCHPGNQGRCRCFESIFESQYQLWIISQNWSVIHHLIHLPLRWRNLRTSRRFLPLGRTNQDWESVDLTRLGVLRESSLVSHWLIWIFSLEQGAARETSCIRLVCTFVHWNTGWLKLFVGTRKFLFCFCNSPCLCTPWWLVLQNLLEGHLHNVSASMTCQSDSKPVAILS